MAKKCSITKNVYGNALIADGIPDFKTINKSILSKKDIKKVLSDSEALIGLEDARDIQTDHNKVIKALEAIPEFTDYGLIFPPGEGKIAQSAKKFIGDIAVSTTDAAGIMNSLNHKGVFTGVESSHIKQEGKKLTSDYTAEHLNSMANNYLNKRVVMTQDKNYFSKNKDGSLRVSKQLMNDLNRYNYSMYLTTVGDFAQESMNSPSKVEPVIKDQVKELRSTPVTTHINTSIAALRAQMKEIANAPTFDKQTHTSLQNKITILTNKKDSFKEVLIKEQLFHYFKDILSDVEFALNQPGRINKERMELYGRTLDMIINAGDGTESNRILDFDEIHDTELFDAMADLKRDAEKLLPALNEAVFQTTKGLAEDHFKTKITDKEMKSVENMTGYRKYAQYVLGLGHIDNPITNYIESKIANASIRAFAIARTINDKITDLFKATRDNGFDTNIMNQLDENELPTGRLVDRFSSKYFKDKGIFKTKYNKNRPIFSADTEKLLENSIFFDPYKLFGLKEGDPARVEHENELKEMLGQYAFNMYYTEASAQWDSFQASEELFLATNPTASAHSEWLVDNSPTERINSINANITDNTRGKYKPIRGTDRFLITVPRRYDINGKDLGWYDQAFDQIEGNKPAMEMYSLVRETFIKQELTLHRYDSKFKPPHVAYVSKTSAELLRTGKYNEATREVWENHKNKYLQSDVRLQKLPKDPITGKDKKRVTNELHTVADEIRSIAQRIYGKDVEYQSLDSSEGDDRKRMQEIKDDAYKQAAIQVKAEQSDNFLHSITMANYATELFIQRSLIETEINLAVNLVRGDILKYPFSESDGFKSAKSITKAALTHYLDMEFYDSPNEEQPTFLRKSMREKAKRFAKGEETEEDKLSGTKGMTVQNLAKSALGVTRFTVLGFSPVLAAINVGQAAVSNVIKAIEGNYFSVPHLMSSYKDIMLPKNRILIERLSVIGDIAYLGDKKNLHNTKDDWRILNPMYAQTAAEKINQGAVAIAIMKGHQVTNSVTGETTSIFSALDDNAELSDDWISTEFNAKGMEVLVQVTAKRIRPANAQASGDYNNPLLLESSMLGRMTMLFRKYLPEMVYDRFGERRTSRKEGREIMGRFTALGSVLTKAVRKYAMGEKTEADKLELNGAKAAVAELVLVSLIYALFMGLRINLCDTMECKKKKGVTLFMLNFLGRLSGDVLALVNPGDYGAIAASPLTIVNMFQNYGKAFNNLASYVLPGGDDGLYKQDTDFYDKGDAKFTKNIKDILPFWKTNYGRVQQMSNKLRYDPILSSVYNKD